MAKFVDSYDPNNKLNEIKAWYDETARGAPKIAGTNYVRLFERLGFHLDAKIWKNLRANVSRSGMEDEFDFGDWIEGYLFLDSSARNFNAVAQNERAPNGSLHQLLQNGGYVISENTAKFVAVIADKNNSGSFDFEGFIEAQLFIRFSLDHFWHHAQKINAQALPYASMKECLPWLGVNNASEQEATRLFRLADSDNSGAVDPEEFLVIVVKLRNPDRTRNL